MTRAFWTVLTLAITVFTLVGCHAAADVGH
jgi:hypothetical protein